MGIEVGDKDITGIGDTCSEYGIVFFGAFPHSGENRFATSIISIESVDAYFIGDPDFVILDFENPKVREDGAVSDIEVYLPYFPCVLVEVVARWLVDLPTEVNCGDGIMCCTRVTCCDKEEKQNPKDYFF